MHTYLFLYALLLVVTFPTTNSRDFLGRESPSHTHPDAAVPIADTWGGHVCEGLRWLSCRGIQGFLCQECQGFWLGTSSLNLLHHEKPWLSPWIHRQVGPTKRWVWNNPCAAASAICSPCLPAAELCQTHSSQKWGCVSRNTCGTRGL